MAEKDLYLRWHLCICQQSGTASVIRWFTDEQSKTTIMGRGTCLRVGV